MSANANPVKSRDFHRLSSVWNIIFNCIAGGFALLCIFPFLFVVLISFTDEGRLRGTAIS